MGVCFGTMTRGGARAAFAAIVVAICLRAPEARGAELQVAVLEFANTSPERELDSLGKGLQSMVTTDLAQVPSFKLVERARLHDIQSELGLGKSGLVDKATAARVGKLLGATHLVAGTFTVVGNKMRIDGRLFAVEGGNVLLAEKIEGERDAFFELEKSLVGKIIDAAGVKLSAKERGVVNRVHTVDYEAFRSFSNGVALFDEQKYEEAIAALRAAQTRDADFRLATVTLAEYQQILAKVRGRADELQTTEAQLQSLAVQKGARDETDAIRKLYAIADRKSGRDPIDRLAALYLLAVAYGNIDRNLNDTTELAKLEDRFALQRTADALVQSYWAEAEGLFPRLPPVVRDQFDAKLPHPPQTVDDALARTRKALLGGFPENCRPESTRERALLCNLEWNGVRDDPVRDFPHRLHLDGLQTAELHMRLYELGVKLGAPPEWRQKRMRELAEELRGAGALDRSTALYQALAGSLTSAEDVRGVAHEIETNQAVAEALARAPLKELLREQLQLSGSVDDVKNLAAERQPPPALLRSLGKLRAFPTTGHSNRSGSDLYVIVGAKPVWVLQEGWYTLTTGPRTDALRAGSIRFARLDAADTVDTMLIIEGVPRRDVHLELEVNYDAPADFYNAREERLPARPARPEVGILFGARDLDCDKQGDEKGGKVVARPMRAELLALREDAIELVDVAETERGVNGRLGVLREAKRFARTVRTRQAADLRARKLAVEVDIAGDTATVRVNGTSASFKVPAERTGFYGLQFNGVGYVEVRGIKTGAR